MFVQHNAFCVTHFNNMQISISAHGYVETDATWHGEQIVSPFTRLYFVRRGRGILTCDEETMIIRPGCVYLIPAGLRYSFRGDPSVQKFFVHIHILKPDGYDLMYNFGRFGELETDGQPIERMIRLYNGNAYTDYFAFCAEIYQTILEFLTKYSCMDKPERVYSEIVQNAIQYIRKNLSAQLSSQQVSRELYISCSALLKKFKAETGVTFSHYIEDMVFFSAQRKLVKTDLSIGQISDMLGFCDRFYFSRRFKQRFGETPSAYRKHFKGI